MSFDLYTWHEDAPITDAEARAKLQRWDDGAKDVFLAHPSVRLFYDALLDRFPPLEAFSDDDIDRLAVWSVTPAPSDEIVALSCVWPRAEEVGTAVLELAAVYGLVCYEPGYHILNPNAPGYTATFTLSSQSLPTMPDPDDRRVEWVMSQLGNANQYVILDRADGWFVQAGYGPVAGVPAGTYALEYQEGSTDRHFRCQTTDLQEAVRLMREFLDGDHTFKRRHQWTPL